MKLYTTVLLSVCAGVFLWLSEWPLMFLAGGLVARAGIPASSLHYVDTALMVVRTGLLPPLVVGVAFGFAGARGAEAYLPVVVLGWAVTSTLVRFPSPAALSGLSVAAVLLTGALVVVMMVLVSWTAMHAARGSRVRHGPRVAVLEWAAAMLLVRLLWELARIVDAGLQAGQVYWVSSGWATGAWEVFRFLLPGTVTGFLLGMRSGARAILIGATATFCVVFGVVGIVPTSFPSPFGMPLGAVLAAAVGSLLGLMIRRASAGSRAEGAPEPSRLD